MMTTVNPKGQITIPKIIRETLGLTPGCPVQLEIDEKGRIVIVKKTARKRRKNRFERFRGRATVQWRTDELMRLLRDAP